MMIDFQERARRRQGWVCAEVDLAVADVIEHYYGGGEEIHSRVNIAVERIVRQDDPKAADAFTAMCHVHDEKFLDPVVPYIDAAFWFGLEYGLRLARQGAR